MKPEAFLFISHTAARTGAPIELLRFLGWLQKNTPNRILIILQHGGEMEADFRALGTTRVWKRAPRKANRWVRKIRDLLRWEAVWNRLRLGMIRRWLARYRVELVYANTAFVGETLGELKSVPGLRVCRLHEMEYTLRNYSFPRGFRSFQRTLGLCGQYIVVSDAVARNLTRNHGVPMESVRKVHGSVEPVDREYYLNPKRISSMKETLGIPPGSPVVGGCGWIQWRKGPDLFVQLAALARRMQREDIHFLWLGGDREDLRFRQLAFDIDQAGLSERVHLTGHQADPYPYYALMHVLAMVSREDPFPLVNLEAGLLGIPIVCFQGGGGSEEWSSRGCGRVVPYLDMGAFWQQIRLLLDDRELREKMGANCRREAENLLVDRNAPRLYRVLQDIRSGSG